MTIQIKNADTIKSDFIKFLRSAIEENGGPNVTDYNIGSVLNVLVEAFADVLENYYYDLFQVTRDSLENIYNGFNFFKIPGKKAISTVSIYIDAAPSDLNTTYFSIPRGTNVATEDGAIVFEIVDDYVQPTSLASTGEFAGKAEYIVRAMCTEAGSAGNVSENALTTFTSTIVNINNVAYWIRSSSASGGADAEAETDMKNRFQKYLISLRRGSKEALEYALVTNAAFTGLLYSISGFRFLNIVKQFDGSIGTNNYDTDLTYYNKFSPSYTLFTNEDSFSDDPFAIYFGAEDKFNNLLFSTQTVPADDWVMTGMDYFDSVTNDWEAASVLNVTFPIAIVPEQYLTWEIPNGSPRWGKFQIKDYNSYFIRINMEKSGAGIDDLDVYKVMTYPFPGYIDIYCLKNYRDRITIDDKTLIAESIDNFKAAGVITTVTEATVVQINPVVILHTNDLTKSLIPSDIVSSIRSDIVTFSNQKNVGVDFIRNELYSYLYARYNQYGNLYVYYKYDPSIYEDVLNNRFKEDFRESVLDASVNEKIDLLLSDIYVIKNLNSFVNTLTGYQLADDAPDYSDYYQDTFTSSDIYLAY